MNILQKICSSVKHCIEYEAKAFSSKHVVHREKKIFTLEVCFSNYKIMMLFVSKLYFLIVNDISL